MFRAAECLGWRSGVEIGALNELGINSAFHGVRTCLARFIRVNNFTPISRPIEKSANDAKPTKSNVD